jgi:hypothetical protein
VQEDFRNAGAEAKGSTPAGFASIVRDTYDQWGRMLAHIGFTKL